MAYRQDTLGRDTTAKAVAERLRQEIQHGTLTAGTRLRQNDVAQRFGVSTTPVREAFAQLQAEGLVRIDPHRGAVVFHPSVDDVLEFYEIREALESLAVTHAIPNLRPDVARELAGLIDRMRRTEDARKWLKLNDQFHLRLYEGAGRPRLSERANEQHQEILEACVRGDASGAKRAIKDHLRSASRDLAAFLAARDGDSSP